MHKITAFLLACLGWCGAAYGYGAFVGPDGAIPLEASRTAVVRSADSVDLIVQAKYAGTPGELVWIIALRNFNEPAEDGLFTLAGDAAILDALDAQTRPQFMGQCPDGPSGEQAEYEFAAFGAAQNEALPRRFFPVQEVIDGKLEEYLASLSLTVDEGLQSAIAAAADQNLMFVALRISTGELGVNKVDPIVTIRYPLAPGEDVKLSPRQTAASTAADPSRMLFWVLAGERTQASLTTREIDPAGIEFTAPDTTNYESAFDAFVAATQTRTFVTEHAGAAVVGGFDNAAVDALLNDSGATFLTRLHARLAGAALRAAGSDVVTIRSAGNAEYSRSLNVTGSSCGGDTPDMGGAGPGDAGVTPDTGVDPVDMGDMPSADVGGEPADDDDGGGGCAAADGAPVLPFLCLAFAFTSRRRRR